MASETQVIEPEFNAHQWQQLIALGRAAGDAIMAIYQERSRYQVVQKADQSPVTAADLAAHHCIVAGLPGLLDVPIISEEAPLPPLAGRSRWHSYWLIDPLDGTKEFIAATGEFTVNIALIHQGKPLLGLVHLPVSDITYMGAVNDLGGQGRGAFKYRAGELLGAIGVADITRRQQLGLPLRAMLSQRNANSETRALMAHIEALWPGGISCQQAGSSLKFCRIAEGEADIYPRLAPTSEWDSAAAQAVLEAAGGSVVNAHSKAALQYNQGEGILNPSFIALGDARYPWQTLLP